MANIKKNFGYQIAYRILTVITPLITSPIVSRALQADKLGVYSATYAYADYFVLLAMLGVASYGQRTIAAAKTLEERQKLFWEIYTVQFVASIVALSLYLLSLPIAALKVPDRIPVMLTQGLWIVSCIFSISWFFFGIEEFRVTVIRNLFIKAIAISGIVLFIRKPEHLIWYTLIMAGGTFLSEAVLWISLSRRVKFEKSNWSRIKTHIIPIFRLFIPVVAMSVFHIMDKSMLDWLSTEENVGWYYASDKIVNIPLGLILAVSTVVMSRMSYVMNNEGKDRAVRLLEKSAELTVFLTSAVSFGVACIAVEFVPFFFGPGYEPCVNLLYMFLPVLLIKALGDIVRTQYMIPAKKDTLFIIAVIGGAVANVICNLLFIPKLGATGAVIGTLVAEATVLTIELSGCAREMNFVKIFAKQFPYIIIGAAMAVVVRLFAHAVKLPKNYLQIGAMVLVGAAVYLLLCVLLWLFKKNSIFPAYAKSLYKRLARSKGRKSNENLIDETDEKEEQGEIAGNVESDTNVDKEETVRSGSRGNDSDFTET